MSYPWAPCGFFPVLSVSFATNSAPNVVGTATPVRPGNPSTAAVRTGNLFLKTRVQRQGRPYFGDGEASNSFDLHRAIMGDASTRARSGIAEKLPVNDKWPSVAPSAQLPRTCTYRQNYG